MKAFVICRDQATYADRCVDALLDVGLDVTIVDHGSTWPAMLHLLEEFDRLGLTVLRQPNAHPRSLWADGTLFDLAPDEPYLVTDCDVIPAADCPTDWPQVLLDALAAHPHAIKAGLGLATHDLPGHYEHAAHVREWEAQYNSRVVATEPVLLHDGDIDTTLAIYRRQRMFTLGPALRTGAPYLAQHLPWYADSAHPTAEETYYREHATAGMSHWADPRAYEGAA